MPSTWRRAAGASRCTCPKWSCRCCRPATTPLLGLGLSEFSPALSFGITVTRVVEISDVEVHAQHRAGDAADLRGRDRAAGRGAARQAAAISPSVYEARRNGRRGGRTSTCPRRRCGCATARSGSSRCRRCPARDIVENCMILTGEAVARYAQERRHPPALLHPGRAGRSIAEPPQTLSGMFALRRTMKRSQYRSSARPARGPRPGGIQPGDQPPAALPGPGGAPAAAPAPARRRRC